MDEWKKWLNADYAFSNNGEKIKKVVKAAYTISLILFFFAAAIGLIGFLKETSEGYFECVWYVPLLIILAVLLAPFLIYWNLSFVYGFGELVSNSYSKNGKNEMSSKKSFCFKKTNSHNNKNVIKHSHNFVEDHSSQKRCPFCGNWTDVADNKCRICGRSFEQSKT